MKRQSRDGTGGVSIAAGVGVEQVEAVNREAVDGVKYHPVTGDMHYRSRGAKLNELHRRAMVDFKEVRGGGKDVTRRAKELLGYDKE